MQLVEKHVVKESNKNFRVLDELCFKSKNLYNSTLYTIRQEYIKNGIYLSYGKVQKEFQDTKNFDYTQLPAKVSQSVMRKVDKNFTSFFAALKDWKEHVAEFVVIKDNKISNIVSNLDYKY